jgi:hypothetical protein
MFPLGLFGDDWPFLRRGGSEALACRTQEAAPCIGVLALRVVVRFDRVHSPAEQWPRTESVSKLPTAHSPFHVCRLTSLLINDGNDAPPELIVRPRLNRATSVSVVYRGPGQPDWQIFARFNKQFLNSPYEGYVGAVRSGPHRVPRALAEQLPVILGEAPKMQEAPAHGDVADAPAGSVRLLQVSTDRIQIHAAGPDLRCGATTLQK